MDAYLRRAFHKGVPPLFVTIKKLYTDPFKVRVCRPGTSSKIFFAQIVSYFVITFHPFVFLYINFLYDLRNVHQHL